VLRIILLTLTGLVMAVSPMGVGSASDTGNTDSLPCPDSSVSGLTLSERLVGEFGYYYYLYSEAILNDDTAALAENERQLTQLVECDLRTSEGRVRELARKVTLAGEALPSGAESTDGIATGSLSGERMLFCLSLESLNTKEAVLRDIRKVYDLKHKYRLLGDYLNLLRRELNMPSLRLATSGAAPSNTPAGDIQNDKR
jgi:hypothetical protein